ncbi:hypothetical protein M0802_016035 [Mischocyttarus mexicanus]|nr:hypothetical protein M0802_016035 [Mischocyttarus mexicanus]
MTFLRKGPVVLIAWKDKRIVRMVSTIHDALIKSSGNRKKNYKDDTIKPTCILQYNKHMKEGDRADQLVEQKKLNPSEIRPRYERLKEQLDEYERSRVECITASANKAEFDDFNELADRYYAIGAKVNKNTATSIPTLSPTPSRVTTETLRSIALPCIDLPHFDSDLIAIIHEIFCAKGKEQPDEIPNRRSIKYKGHDWDLVKRRKICQICLRQHRGIHVNSFTMACISTQPSQSSPSYAKVTGNISFPKKDQAVIIDVIDDSQLKVYVQAISKLIDPAHIRFISRIANNRICIYVATKEIADELIDKHKAILLNGKSLPIRPLISRKKRIIFSNVCPIIPHNVLEEKLKEWKIKPMSTMTFLRAGLTDQGFSHILSFRKQIFITPEDIEKLPESFQITYEDTTYWIYVSSDNISCFLCKKEGHIAKNCSEKPLNPPSVPLISSEIISNSTTPTIKYTELDHQQIQEQTGIKRPHPSTSSDTLSLDTSASLIPKYHHSLNVDNTSNLEMYLTDASQTSSKQDKRTKHLKKRKQYQEFNSEEIEWKVIDSNLNIPGKSYPLNITQLRNFLEKTFGVKDIRGLINEFECDSKQLALMLRDIYPEMPNRSSKNRISTIIKKLEAIKTANQS